MNNIINATNLTKSFDDVGQKVDVLKSVDFTIAQAEMVAIVGASGSGKSTLLHLLAGLDKPDEGNVFINDQDFFKLSERKKCKLRNHYLGFIYQFHHLLPEFSALENVAMPWLIRGVSAADAREKSKEILEQAGLADRLHHKVAELSGGERQRAAIARALVHQPQCVLADEPTGNLDPYNAEVVFEMMVKLQQELKTSFILVTHDINIAKRADRILLLEASQLIPYDK